MSIGNLKIDIFKHQLRKNLLNKKVAKSHKNNSFMVILAKKVFWGHFWPKNRQFFNIYFPLRGPPNIFSFKIDYSSLN